MGLHAAERESFIALQREYDGVRMFRSLYYQDQVFKSDVRELLVMGGNRSGKSVSAAVKFAACARDLPVQLSDGTLVEQRLPWQKDRPLLMWCIGINWDHICTFYRLLFRRGLYKVIRDEVTGMYRIFDPDKDAHRIDQCKQSWPLIPEYEIRGGLDGMAYYNRKEDQFSQLILQNGTIIRAYASSGSVKMGDPVDYIWLDEDIAYAEYYSEWQARLPDTKGRIVWSTLPSTNPAILNLYERAKQDALDVNNGHKKKPDVEVIQLATTDNPYLEDDEKRKLIEGLSKDEVNRRIYGHLEVEDLLIYPQFDKTIHAAICLNQKDDDDLSRYLRMRNGVPSRHWTHELIIDPGTQHPGVLFCAVPPPLESYRNQEFRLWNGDEPFWVVYDEIYVPRQTAAQLAKIIAAKLNGVVLERMIIDGKAAAQTPMGFAGTIGQRYSEEFSSHGIVSRQTGSAFIYGDPNFATASKLVESALLVRPTGKPKLRVVVQKCPSLVRQLERNTKAYEYGPERQKIVLDKEAKGQLNDLRRCLEYWVSRKPRYIPSAHKGKSSDHMFELYKELQKRYNKTHGDKEHVTIGAGLTGALAPT